MYSKCISTAEHLFEFEKKFLISYTYLCIQSHFLVAQIGIATISIISIITQISRPTFQGQNF